MPNSIKSSIENRYKIIYPNRIQREFQMFCLDDLIPEDHKARAVWEFIERMNIDSCFDDILTFENAPGRSTTSPKVLLCLWIYSIMDGNISARKLEELCTYHNVYKWIAGNVPINRTMLSDFRSKNPEKFEEVLTDCLAVMVKAGVLNDQDFSQDGTRIKANAGMGSFRREKSLENLQAEIKQHINTLELELNTNPKSYDARTTAAKKRAVEERSQHVNKALENLNGIKKKRIEQSKKERSPIKEEELVEIRASTTDPEARKMKMGDSGYRAAFNIQFATGVQSRVIFGVDVVNTLDPGTSPKMIQKVNGILDLFGMPRVRNWNADSAYSSKEDIEKVDKLYPECNYNSPAKLKKGLDPKKYQRGDSESVKKWRDRLDTPEMNEAYKYRCSTAEFSNAQTKNHGFTEVLVRGIKKVYGMAHLHAIGNNIMRYFDLVRKSQAYG